jgi:hypothetical protein
MDEQHFEPVLAFAVSQNARALIELLKFSVGAIGSKDSVSGRLGSRRLTWTVRTGV